MLAKLTLGFLSACLFIVVGFFLYTTYFSSSPAQTGPTSPLSTQVLPSASNTDQTLKTVDSVKSEDATEVAEQPDKSLPIPGHQLKKLMAESKDNDELDQKIARANEAIAQIDAQLGQPQETETATSPSASENDQQLQQRIQHIRDHLAKKEEQ